MKFFSSLQAFKPIMTGQRPIKRIKTKKYKSKPIDPVGSQAVLLKDIHDLLASKDIDPESTRNDMQAFFDRDRSARNSDYKVVNLMIEKLSSTGDGLAVHEDPITKRKRVILVPYSLPGDDLTARIHRTEEHYFEAQTVKINTSAPDRDDSLIKCKYFGVCSGCQYQMLPYEKQLEIKRNAIISAYRHYAPLLKIPDIGTTVASPSQYGYRTKLTPHFDRPSKYSKGQLPIGFSIKGSKTIIDIEECPIGTPILNSAISIQRRKVLDNIDSYKNGATILLREKAVKDKEGHINLECTSNPKEIILEFVAESQNAPDGRKFKFKYPAGSFFQNNNSILPVVTSYVRENIKLPDGSIPKYLVDTYCGSGLFAVTCSSAVEKVIGVEISQDSVKYAIENAKLNELANANFIVGQAEKIFEKVDTPNDQTSIIIDPPRKGCDTAFLDQLIAFSPIKIVYVSCNVHSQARDLEYLVQKQPKYIIESIRGFDFFPQTHHVESVAVLRLN